MKVFELMNELAKVPAGADVHIVGYFTEQELVSSTISTEIADNKIETIKGMEFNLDDVIPIDDFFVNLGITSKKG